jgi:hypothetical protein
MPDVAGIKVIDTGQRNDNNKIIASASSSQKINSIKI